MERVSRRQFLVRTGLASSAATLGGLVALGVDPAPLQAATVPQRFRIRDARVVPSVCPYCAVGCGLLIHAQGNEVVNIEGNPDSPISRGALCPKGAATFQLAVNPRRQTKCLRRAPGGTEWEEIDLERAMEMVTDRVQTTRDATFRRTATVEGREMMVNHTLGIASLGGATLDNEWNYVQAKLWRGLGGVFIENQARI